MDWNFTYFIVTLYGNLMILVLYISSFFKQNYKNLLSILSIFTIALIISLREAKVALDTPKYVELFLKNDVNSFYQAGVNEIGFILLNKLIYLYTTNYHFFLFLITFLHLSVVLILYRMFSIKFFPLLLAMYIATFVFWLSNLSMLRQGLAIPIISLSIYYLVFKDNKKMFLLFSVIAGSLHFSAIPLSMFIMGSYLFYKNLPIVMLKIFLFLIILLVVYPQNIFINIIMYILSLFSQYNNFFPIINKIIWYFNWHKFEFWHVKHVYFLLVLLFAMLGVIEKDKKHLLLLLIPFSLIAVLKYDEMVTDRLFMYFIPLIPYIILHFFLKINFLEYKKTTIIILLLMFSTLVWFNIKFILLQYQDWFIYPYPRVR